MASLWENMKTNNHGNRKRLIFIILAGLILRLAFFVAVRPWQDNYITGKIIMVDAEPYNNFALSILKDRSFEHTGTYRTPGYPLFLAFVYALFGARPWVVILIQVFIGTFTIFLVHLWARQWFNERVANISALLYAVEPHVIVYGACLLTETLFVFIVLLSVYMWYRGIRNENIIYVSAGALLLGYSALVRPILIVFPGLLIVLSLFLKGARPGFKIKSSLVMILFFSLAVSPWLVKNYLQYGHFSLTHINGYNLLYVSAAYTEVARTGKTYLDVCRDFDVISKEKGAFATSDLFKQSDIFSGIALTYMRDHPGLYIRRHLTGMVTLFTNLASTDTMDLVGLDSMKKKYNVYEFHNFIDMIKWYFQNKTFDEIFFGLSVSAFLILTYLFCFYGIWAALSDKLYSCLINNISIAFYFCFMTGVFGVARYRLPLIPFYIIFSAYGITKLLGKLSINNSLDKSGSI